MEDKIANLKKVLINLEKERRNVEQKLARLEALRLRSNLLSFHRNQIRYRANLEAVLLRVINCASIKSDELEKWREHMLETVLIKDDPSKFHKFKKSDDYDDGDEHYEVCASYEILPFDGFKPYISSLHIGIRDGELDDNFDWMIDPPEEDEFSINYDLDDMIGYLILHDVHFKTRYFEYPSE